MKRNQHIIFRLEVIRSINQFIAVAVAEKISAMATEQFFADRLKQSDLEAFRAILFRPGGEPPRKGDEL